MNGKPYNLFAEVQKAGIPWDNHESDLYIKGTPEAFRLVREGACYFETFTNQVYGGVWIDVPFAYAPFWEEKL